MSWADKFQRLKDLADVFVPPPDKGAVHAENGSFDGYTYRIEIKAVPDRGSFSWIITTFWWFADKDGKSWNSSAQREAYWIDAAIRIVEANKRTVEEANESVLTILFIPPRLRRFETWPADDPDLGM